MSTLSLVRSSLAATATPTPMSCDRLHALSFNHFAPKNSSVFFFFFFFFFSLSFDIFISLSLLYISISHHIIRLRHQKPFLTLFLRGFVIFFSLEFVAFSIFAFSFPLVWNICINILPFRSHSHYIPFKALQFFCKLKSRARLEQRQEFGPKIPT